VSAERRRDPLSGQEVIIAPGRAARPHDDASFSERGSRRTRLDDCPLCPGNENMTPPTTMALTDGGASEVWSVRVIPNLYPIVSTVGDAAPQGPGRNATGVHEVVVETRRHDEELADRSPRLVALLLDAFQARLRELEGRPETRQVQVFKNKGSEAGTSLEHPHSQIVALDFVPDLTARRIRRMRRHLREKGRCLLCAIVVDELAQGSRVIFEDQSVVALAPYASSWAGEVLLVPLSHAPSLSTASNGELEKLGRSLVTLLRRVKTAFDDPPYNLVLHTAPARRRGDPALHWYWQLTPRMTRQAGLEVGTSLHVNPLPPEDVAAMLRNDG
jgi:UDPglucose--hexose-1-phosphate uridylyltransferase